MFLPNKIYEYCIIISILLIVISSLFFSNIPTPYGRFFKEDIWGPSIDEKKAWAIMEATGLIMFILFYFILGKNNFNIVPLIFLGIWSFHYINRSIIYPYFIMKQKYKQFPLILVIFGFFYLSLFSYINAINISSNPKYIDSWIKTPQFIIGCTLFSIGFILTLLAISDSFDYKYIF